MCVAAHGAAAQTCDGKYAEADTLIEAAYGTYGTLYSGGHNYESVGPTLEIYRLLNGLPDSGMATRRPGSAEFLDPAPDAEFGGYSPQFVGETMLRSLPRIQDPDFRRDTPAGSYDVEILLNRLSVLGPYAGWWLTPDAPHLSEIEKAIAQYAFDDGLDWLLSVQAASARPHQTSWHLQRWRMPRDMSAVLNNAALRYMQTKDLTWMIAVETLVEGNDYYLSQETHAARDDITARFAALRTAVTDCSATPADYTAFSIAAFEKLRQNSQRRFDLDLAQELPPVLRRIAATQMAKMGMREYSRADGPTASELAALSTDPAFASWHNVGRSMRADDIDDLIAIHQGTPLDPKTYRILNLLTADDLLRFAASREPFEDEHRSLTTTAFLRLFALGRDSDAAELVEQMQTLWPDRADLMADLWNTSAPRDVALARVALTLPEPRVLVVPPSQAQANRDAFNTAAQADHHLEFWSRVRRSRDLPVAIRTGGFLMRDATIWMQAIGTTPYSGWSATRRTYSRGILAHDVLAGLADPIPQSGYLYYRNIGIAGFAGWDELARLGPQSGLANRIGTVLVRNARAETDGFWSKLTADNNQLAAEMVMVIQQGRQMIHGEMGGRPLGQAAFAVLQGPLSETEAAKATPYWFICRERCEP